MTPLAIAFMLLAMLIIWGGLAAAITFLVKNPLEDDDATSSRPTGRRPRT
ncbi:methionine/alanine import family NSS transporter small subunit [Georgenia phoenicis]